MAKQIKIKGAGPAGLSAAISLARENYPVTVYEKNSDCGKRFRGDLQGLENWTSSTNIIDELTAMGLDLNFDCTPIQTLTGVNPGREVSIFRSRQPLFYLVKRGPRPGALDQGLKEQALKLGVNIEFNASDEEEVDIVASGPDPRRLCAIDTGIVFETDAPDAAYGMLDDRSAYKGYSYLLITGGYGCMCTVLFDRFSEIHHQFDLAQRAFRELTGVQIRNPSPVGGYGNFSIQSRFVKDKKLYVGEAAGLQDLLWGFGIRFAVRSGHLAARCLIENRDYAAEAKKRFNHTMRAGIVNRAIWENMGNQGYKIFLTLGRYSKNPRQFLHNLFQYNLWRRTVFPLALWDLHRRHPDIEY